MSFDGVSIKRLLKGIQHQPLTPNEEKIVLKKAVKDDPDARDRLVEANQRFVVRMAISYRNQGLSVADLIQEGNLGLIEAIDRFDLTKNCRLISYAAWWIRLFMQRALEQKSRTVTIPINKISALKKIKNFEYGYAKTHGRQPTYEEIADGIGMTQDKVEYIANLGTSTVSIQAKDDEEGLSIEDQLEIDEAGPLRHHVWLGELNRRVSNALEMLTPREEDVIRCRFGLNGEEEPASLRQAGRRLGLSAEGIRQIQVQAMKKLGDPEFGAGLQCFAH